MKIKWLGHACFLLTSENGLRVITDPYTCSNDITLRPVSEKADIVTISHDHKDHNNVSSVNGNPEVTKGNGNKEIRGINFKGIPTYHDGESGTKRGNNTIFCFQLDGIKICHLGDLGHELAENQVSEIGEVDVLLIPVGGFYTIDAAAATRICAIIKPRVIIPMHFKNPKVDFPIAGVDEFLQGKDNVSKYDSNEISLTKDRMPSANTIIVLEPANL